MNITGRVTNKQGEPVIYATVFTSDKAGNTIFSKTKGTLTDENGNYTLDIGLAGYITARHVSYKPKTVAFNGVQVVYDFQLDRNSLPEVVVTADRDKPSFWDKYKRIIIGAAISAIVGFAVKSILANNKTKKLTK